MTLARYESNFNNTKAHLLDHLEEDLPEIYSIPLNLAMTRVPTSTLENQLDGMVISMTLGDQARGSTATRLSRAIKTLGITKYNLACGTYVDQHGRKAKLSKLFAHNSTAIKDLKHIQTAQGIDILLTSNPWMKLTISTCRKWESCLYIDDEDIIEELLEDGPYLVAYIYKKGQDFDKPRDALGRMVFATGGCLDNASLVWAHNRFGIGTNCQLIHPATIEHPICSDCQSHLIKRYHIRQPDSIVPARMYSHHRYIRMAVNKIRTKMAQELASIVRVITTSEQALNTALEGQPVYAEGLTGYAYRPMYFNQRYRRQIPSQFQLPIRNYTHLLE